MAPSMVVSSVVVWVAWKDEMTAARSAEYLAALWEILTAACLAES